MSNTKNPATRVVSSFGRRQFERGKVTRDRVELDVLGREFRFEVPPSRIVSLVPSLTETLFDLGLGDRIVGVTDYCIFPDIPSVTPRLGGTKKPDIDRIRELRPDIVYVNVEENLRRHAEAIESFAPVFATEPARVQDVRALLEQLGRIHRREEGAAEWVRQIDAVIVRTSDREPFTFACPIWKDPWMWCGGDTYVSDLVATVGGRNVLTERRRYPRAGLEEIKTLDPEVIFLPDEPYEFSALDRAGLERVGFSRIVGPFPGHLFTWHGTRTLQGMKYLLDVMSDARSPGEEVAQDDSRRLKGHE